MSNITAAFESIVGSNSEVENADAEAPMTQARRSSKRKRGNAALSKKAVLAFGAAGVSLAMTGAASASAPPTTVPALDNTRQFILAEEEISDVSLATFHIFDRENPSLSQDIKEARGGCGRCGGGGGGRCAGGGGGRCAGAGGGRCAAAGCAAGGRCAGAGRCAAGRCAVGGRCACRGGCACAVGVGRACLGCAGCTGTCTQWDPNLGQWVNVCY